MTILDGEALGLSISGSRLSAGGVADLALAHAGAVDIERLGRVVVLVETQSGIIVETEGGVIEADALVARGALLREIDKNVALGGLPRRVLEVRAGPDGGDAKDGTGGRGGRKGGDNSELHVDSWI